MSKPEWIKVRDNELLRGQGFYISFLPGNRPTNPWGEVLSGLANAITSEPEYLESLTETALVKDHIFYILNGDFRKEYEGIIDQGFDACLAFYEFQREDHGSVWSTKDV